MKELEKVEKSIELKSNQSNYELVKNVFASNYGYNVYNSSRISGINKRNPNFVNGEALMKKR